MLKVGLRVWQTLVAALGWVGLGRLGGWKYCVLGSDIIVSSVVLRIVPKF